MTSTITLTFCECAENHVGMEKIGTVADTGYSIETLQKTSKYLDTFKIQNRLITIPSPFHDSIVTEAAILLIPMERMTSSSIDEVYETLESLEDYWDKKALIGRGAGAIVKNKHARWNLIFADFDQEPNYEDGQGTVINFSTVREIKKLKDFFESLMEEDAPLYCEANYYYDLKKTYIGFHGDTERRKVIGVRFGQSMPLFFRWFKDGHPIGPMYAFNLSHGDAYIMSDKAVGYDWKRRSIYTLRHAAGVENVLRKTPGPSRMFENIPVGDVVYLA